MLFYLQISNFIFRQHCPPETNLIFQTKMLLMYFVWTTVFFTRCFFFRFRVSTSLFLLKMSLKLTKKLYIL